MKSKKLLQKKETKKNMVARIFSKDQFDLSFFRLFASQTIFGVILLRY